MSIQSLQNTRAGQSKSRTAMRKRAVKATPMRKARIASYTHAYTQTHTCTHTYTRTSQYKPLQIRSLKNLRTWPSKQRTAMRNHARASAQADLCMHTYAHSKTHTQPEVSHLSFGFPCHYGASKTLAQGKQNQRQLCEITRPSAQADLYMHTCAHSKTQALHGISHLSFGFPCQYGAFKTLAQGTPIQRQVCEITRLSAQADLYMHTYAHSKIQTLPEVSHLSFRYPCQYGAFKTLAHGSQNQGQLSEITRASAQADLYMHTYAHSKTQTQPEVSDLSSGFPCQYGAFKTLAQGSQHQ